MALPSGTQPDAGAKLMALLTDTRPEIWHSRPATCPTPENAAPVLPAGPPVSNLNPVAIAHSDISKGRHLNGDHVVYDVDGRLPGEVQSPLEVSPITRYCTHPALVLGRQIAVNKTYVCYGLKLGAIRVLNMHAAPALRSLLKGHSQAVRDMAFFSVDVNLLASASADGRVFIWKITEGTDDEDKPQITGKIVMAIQIVGLVKFTHSRVCWHCHKQEVLVVGIGNSVLRINTTNVGKVGVYSEGEPLKCSVDKMIDGVEFVGNHDGEVTDLSMCTTCLVSASVDGTIKVWEEGKLLPIAVLRPYDGQPVCSVTFLTSPHKPQHIVLVTGGPLNREIKIWTSTSEDGWLPPSDADSWRCTQTLELKSSAGTRDEYVFFNQVMPVSQAGLLLIANATKNALYAVHLDYGPNPAATRMDYIAEFSVSMPILSLTATSDLVPHGEQIVLAFCVQTNVIQQFSFDLSQCLPPPLENLFERLNLSFSDQECAEVATSLEVAT